jgi:hypothetical protein
MNTHSFINVTKLQAVGVPQLREPRTVITADSQPEAALIDAVHTGPYPLSTAPQRACRMTDADLNAARTATRRACLTKAYALQANTALAEIDRFRRYFNELRKFTTLPTMLMASTEMFSLPR